MVGVLAGSETFTGAAVLAVGGAVHGGAGMVRFASVQPVVELVRQRWPEVVTTVIEPDDAADDDPGAGTGLTDVGRVQAWVIGPGIGTGRQAHEALAAVLGTDLPVLVDADGLTVLARHRELLRRSRGATVLTPHAGELARLLGADRAEVEARRLEYARRAAAELGVTVLLKGSTTLVAEADRPVRINPTGTPWLATAGTGDVLSGLVGALLAGGLAAIEAATVGAYLHGLAARRAAAGAGTGGAAAHRFADLADGLGGPGTAPISAHDVVRALPAAFRTVRS